MREEGILVGSDITQEWLLPWWWKRYRQHNSFPVAFVDFGLSFAAKDWCRERGELIPIRMLSDFVQEKEAIDPATISVWENEFGRHFWEDRNVWFKKPFAMLQTPFLKTLWIDADCEIRAPLTPLFAYADEAPGFALAKDQCKPFAEAGYPIYNSGVIAFRHGIDLLRDWARACREINGSFRGDQEVLSHLLSEKNLSVTEISPYYNWSRMQEEGNNALILHWHGPAGKTVIRNQIQQEECYA